MTMGIVSYSDFMVVGIDYGVLCCDSCGALVPFDKAGQHDRFHLDVRAAAEVSR